MKNLIYAIGLVLILAVTSSAQVVNGNFKVAVNDGNNFGVTVKIFLNEGSAMLGNTTLRFKYNRQNLEFPELPQAGADYSFNANINSSFVSVSRPEQDVIAINIYDTLGTLVGTNPQDLVTINFTTLNQAGTADMNWTMLEMFSPGSSTPWTLGAWEYENSVLPVEMRTLTASYNEGVVALNWETVTEMNNHGFEVERSSDKEQWSVITFIKGAGTTTTTQKYSFVDNKLEGLSKIYYRLKQIDADGTYKYSDLVEVNTAPQEFVLHQNYPNPFNPSTTIKYSLPFESEVKLVVYNMLGEQVSELINKVQAAGSYELNFNAGHLASGTYIYSMEAKDVASSKSNKTIKKMVLIK